jgi:hypothetical protein
MPKSNLQGKKNTASGVRTSLALAFGSAQASEYRSGAAPVLADTTHLPSFRSRHLWQLCMLISRWFSSRTLRAMIVK